MGGQRIGVRGMEDEEDEIEIRKNGRRVGRDKGKTINNTMALSTKCQAWARCSGAREDLRTGAISSVTPSRSKRTAKHELHPWYTRPDPPSECSNANFTVSRRSTSSPAESSRLTELVLKRDELNHISGTGISVTRE